MVAVGCRCAVAGRTHAGPVVVGVWAVRCGVWWWVVTCGVV